MIFHACSQNLVRPSFFERTRPFNILFVNIQIIIYFRHYKRIYFQRCSDAIENNVKEYEHPLFSSLFLPLSGLVVCYRIVSVITMSNRIVVSYGVVINITFVILLYCFCLSIPNLFYGFGGVNSN